MRQSPHVSPVRVALALLAGGVFALAMPGVASAQTTFHVADAATLATAITSAASGDQIIFDANITLTADLPAIEAGVTIEGSGHTLSGNNQFRGLFIGAFSGATQVPVTVAVQDLRALATVPRLQEDLTQEIADLVERSLQPRGVYVHVAARHLCMELRGAEGRSRLVTEARRGDPVVVSAAGLGGGTAQRRR